jgi:hypothetical protein
MADREKDRAGLPEKPLSELPGTLAGLAMGIAGGPLSAGLGLASHATTGKSIMENIADFLGLGSGKESMAGVPGLGIENGTQTMASPELQGRNDPSQSMNGPGMADLNAATAAAAEADKDPNGFMFKGGRVRRGLLDLDPPGPDDTVIAAKRGERVLNDRQWAALSPTARREIESLFEKTGARK